VSTFTFAARLWEHAGQGAWHFVTLPDDTSDEIADLTAGVSRGFGSVRVRVTVSGTTWQTSLFPDTKAGGLRAAGQEGGPRRRGPGRR
jgi:hypothetical protein